MMSDLDQSADMSIVIEDAEDNDKPGPTRAECKPNSVSYEAKWFNEPYERPHEVVDSSIPQDVIKKFQELAWNTPNDRMVPGYGLLPKELGIVSSDGRRGWLMTCHFYWLCRQLNGQQRHTRCFVLDPSLSKETIIKKQLAGIAKDETKRLVFVLSVGRQDDGHVFFGDNTNQGDHWSVAVVNILTGQVHYCDTLGWSAPDKFLPTILSYTTYFGFNRINDLKLLMAHEPNEEQHECLDNCSNYPLQTCSDICGVIAMVCIAIATFDSKLFNLLIKPNSDKINVYLTNPTDYSSYLRHVLICWISNSHVDIKKISLKSGYNPYSENKELKRKRDNHINGNDSTRSPKILKANVIPDDWLNGSTASHEFVQECLQNFNKSKFKENVKQQKVDFFDHFTFNNNFQRHKDPNVSSKLYIKEFDDFPINPVIMFKSANNAKPNSKLGENDVAIGIQNDFQAEIMKSYGKTCICMETYPIASQRLHMVTVSVVYEGTHEVPCAWLISNRNDVEVYKMFFEALKTKIGELQTEVFIGDMGFQFYKAWLQVFPKPGRRMFGTWEAVKVLTLRLSSFLDPCKGLDKVKDLINVFTTITDPKEFEKFAKCFLEVVKPLSEDLHEYIKTKYLLDGKDALWAPCRRMHASYKFVPFLNPFSQTLDIVDYSSGVNMIRVDTHLHQLLQLVKYYEAKMKFVVNPSYKKRSTALSQISLNHAKTVERNYDIYRSGSGDEWHIRASDGSESCYVVESTGTRNDSDIKCEKCHVCLQDYVCTCSQYLILIGGCSHIHSIQMYKQFNKDIGNGLASQNDDEEHPFSKQDLLNDCKSLIDKIEQCENEEKLENLHKPIKKFCADL